VRKGVATGKEITREEKGTQDGRREKYGKKRRKAAKLEEKNTETL